METSSWTQIARLKALGDLGKIKDREHNVYNRKSKMQKPWRALYL